MHASREDLNWHNTSLQKNGNPGRILIYSSGDRAVWFGSGHFEVVLPVGKCRTWIAFSTILSNRSSAARSNCHFAFVSFSLRTRDSAILAQIAVGFKL